MGDASSESRPIARVPVRVGVAVPGALSGRCTASKPAPRLKLESYIQMRYTDDDAVGDYISLRRARLEAKAEQRAGGLPPADAAGGRRVGMGR